MKALFFQYSAVFFCSIVIGSVNNEPTSSGFNSTMAGCRTLISCVPQYLSVAYTQEIDPNCIILF